MASEYLERLKTIKAHPGDGGLGEDVETAVAEIEQLREGLDIKGWDEWFTRLQMAVRGSESLINECGTRIERMRQAAEKGGV